MKLLVTLKPEQYMTPFHNYGVLAEIDWESKSIVRHLKVPAASFQDSNAFMACLLNGICTIGNRILVSAWNLILEINYNTFDITNTISWPSMSDLHGMTTDNKNVWVASTSIQAVLCLDAITYDIKWRWGPDEPILYQDAPPSNAKQPLFLKVPFFKRIFHRHQQPNPQLDFIEREYRYIHKSISPYHHHHLNDVRWHEGILYVTTKGWFDGISSAVIRLDPQTRHSEFLVKPGGFKGMHDGAFVNGRFYVTESGGNSVAWLETDGRIVSKPVEPSPYFVRGLCYTGHSFIVGFTTMRGTNLPAQLVEYNDTFTKQLDKMDVSSFYPPEIGTAIHSVVLAPPDAAD